MGRVVPSMSSRAEDGLICHVVVSSNTRQLLRREPDGSLVRHADLAPVSTKPWNDIVVDGRGNAYVNSIGFDFPGEEFAPGIVVGNQHCVRVREGGEVLATVDLDRGAFACTLSRGAGPTLFVVGQDWGGPDVVGGATGRIMTFPAPASGGGHP